MTEVKRNYKDTVFRMIFREKENLLSLYNAINGTHYDNVDELEVNTLENAIYMSMKNDISFVLDSHLNLYEHQASVNPNMPLRDLLYVAKVVQILVKDENLYGSKLVKIPTPRFIVFYNGVENYPARKTLYLSEAFEKQEDKPALELAVTVINLNHGNSELLESCRLLKEYMQYVDKVRKYSAESNLELAVERAVDECIKEDVLREFLLKNRAEVVAMSIFEYDEEKHMKCLRQEGFEEGYGKGEEMKLITLVCRKMQKNKTAGQIAEELEEALDVVEKICEAARKCAPEYDGEAIYQKLHG